jgi:hypothetical protein
MRTSFIPFLTAPIAVSRVAGTKEAEKDKEGKMEGAEEGRN